MDEMQFSGDGAGQTFRIPIRRSKKFYVIRSDGIRVLSRLYDISENEVTDQLRLLVAWNITHKLRRKSSKHMKRHINHWFTLYKTKKGYRPSGPEPLNYDNEGFNDE